MSHTTNLSQHQSDMYMIMYRIYTQKRCKVAVFTHQTSFLVSVWISSLCIVRSAAKQVFFFWPGRFLLFVKEISGSQELILSSPESRIKITKCLDSLTWRYFWCDISLHFFLVQCYQIKYRKSKHTTGCTLKEEGPGRSVLHHGNCQNVRGKVALIKRWRILEKISWGSTQLRLVFKNDISLIF